METLVPTHQTTLIQNSICLSIYLSMAVQPFVGPWPLFSFLILYTVGRAPWTGDRPVSRPLLIHRTTQTQNKRTKTSVPRVGFEPTIPVFKRAKTVHALDRTVTVISKPDHYNLKIGTKHGPKRFRQSRRLV
jgi:hypothetical protein